MNRFEGFKDAVSDYMSGGWLGKGVGLSAILVVVLVMILGIYWSREPALFSVKKNTEKILADSQAQMVTGSVTTATLITISETLLEKPGGFLSNDITPPGILLDNMPNWEYAVLVQVRDLARAMRESFSRSQSQSQEDPDLSKAEPRLNFSRNSWAVPASESEYRDGIKYLRAYLARLDDTESPNSQFYARADNLRYWLGSVESRLGSLSQRLSSSVGKQQLDIDLAGDKSAQQSTTAPGEVLLKTPWHKVDDVFYEARGTTWALIHFLKAVEIDFKDVLDNKNALVSLRQLRRELEDSQLRIYSPIILNGKGFGVVANHSLVMASYISRANAAIFDLRELLSKG